MKKKTVTYKDKDLGLSSIATLHLAGAKEFQNLMLSTK